MAENIESKNEAGKGKESPGRQDGQRTQRSGAELKLTKVRERTRQSPGRNVFQKRNSERSEAGTGSQVCGTGGACCPQNKVGWQQVLSTRETER